MPKSKSSFHCGSADDIGRLMPCWDDEDVLSAEGPPHAYVITNVYRKTVQGLKSAQVLH